MADEIQRRTAQKELAVAEAEIARIDEQASGLARRRAEQVRIRDKAQLTVNGIDPCRKCGRHVPSPCHDWEGYNEGGPWDGSCRSAFYPER